jgi:hypothetical protein
VKLPPPKSSAASHGKAPTDKKDAFDNSFDGKDFFSSDFNANGPGQLFK